MAVRAASWRLAMSLEMVSRLRVGIVFQGAVVQRTLLSLPCCQAILLRCALVLLIAALVLQVRQIPDPPCKRLPTWTVFWRTHSQLWEPPSRSAFVRQHA